MKLRKNHYLEWYGSGRFLFFYLLLCIMISNRCNWSCADDAVADNDIIRIPRAQALIQNENLVGNRSVLFILVNFLDSSIQPFEAKFARSLFFTGEDSINHFFQKNSYNKFGITGDVVGWYTIPHQSINRCDLDTWKNAAIAAARANGVDVDQYQYKSLILGGQTSCPFRGVAELGGNTSWIVSIDTSFEIDTIRRVITHELGHNFGLEHAHFLDCRPRQKSIDYFFMCDTETSISQIGDPFSVMGQHSQPPYLFNAPQKYILGWFEENHVTTLSQDGIYSLSTLESNTNEPKVLRIQTQDPEVDYFISYPTSIPSDTGAVIHILQKNSTQSMDTWIVKPMNIKENLFSLKDRRIFTDPIHGISIQQVNHNSKKVTLSVRHNDRFACVRRTPLIMLGLEGNKIQKGKLISKTMQVANTDIGNTCTKSNFGLSFRAPKGWKIENNVDHFDLDPGQKLQINSISIISAKDGPDGHYAVRLQLRDPLIANHITNKVLNYIVHDGICVSRPVTTLISPPINLVCSGGQASYSVFLRNNDSLACDASQFKLTPIMPDGFENIFVLPVLFRKSGNSIEPHSFVIFDQKITSPKSTPKGRYPIGLRVSDEFNSTHNSEVMGIYQTNCLAR